MRATLSRIHGLATLAAFSAGRATRLFLIGVAGRLALASLLMASAALALIAPRFVRDVLFTTKYEKGR